jgi:hypothetical protein
LSRKSKKKSRQKNESGRVSCRWPRIVEVSTVLRQPAEPHSVTEGHPSASSVAHRASRPLGGESFDARVCRHARRSDVFPSKTPRGQIIAIHRGQ